MPSSSSRSQPALGPKGGRPLAFERAYSPRTFGAARRLATAVLGNREMRRRWETHRPIVLQRRLAGNTNAACHFRFTLSRSHRHHRAGGQPAGANFAGPREGAPVQRGTSVHQFREAHRSTPTARSCRCCARRCRPERRPLSQATTAPVRLGRQVPTPLTQSPATREFGKREKTG